MKQKAKGGKTSPRAARKPAVPQQKPKKVDRTTRRYPPQKATPRRPISPPPNSGRAARVWNDCEARERLLATVPKQKGERARSPAQVPASSQRGGSARGGSQTSGGRRGQSPLREKEPLWK
jgi:hypothetical protein